MLNCTDQKYLPKTDNAHCHVVAVKIIISVDQNLIPDSEVVWGVASGVTALPMRMSTYQSLYREQARPSNQSGFY